MSLHHEAEQRRELGIRFRHQGRLDEAAAALREALALAPADARALAELAHVLRWQGRLDEARGAAERAIGLAPRLAEAWFNLAAVRVAQGETAGGIESYRKALELKPDFAEAWNNLGGAYGATGDSAAELDAYRRAVAANPRLAPAMSNLGSALQQAGRLQEALESCRRATELDPEFAGGWNNLANALHARGEHAQAVHACESALRLEPALGEARATLGAALHSLQRYDEALRAHREAIDAMPGVARLHFNLGLTLQHCGRGAEAIASFRRALALDPDYAQAQWDLAFSLLGSGELREGWERYEWRWRRPEAEAGRYDFTRWNGDVATPRRLLLWGEQGVGDQILYAGMLPELVASALDVTVEIDPRLVALYRRSFPGAAVIAREAPPRANAADYDCQSALGSLGRWLRPSFESFPRRSHYLAADPARADAYRKRLREHFPGSGPRVGISWHSANREFGVHKSSRLRDWVELLRVPGASFVDLQYGDTAAERAGVESAGAKPILHLPDLDLHDDLEGLAALCAACDLVITASNVTAHMAGALGRPVWLLVPEGNGRLWYWFSGRRTSPWYPSMRIHTRRLTQSWSDLIAVVARDLADLVSGQR